MKDIVTGMANGVLLVNLIEVLSEKEFKGKLDLKPKLRANLIDNCNSALKVFTECSDVFFFFWSDFCITW